MIDERSLVNNTEIYSVYTSKEEQAQSIIEASLFIICVSKPTQSPKIYLLKRNVTIHIQARKKWKPRPLRALQRPYSGIAIQPISTLSYIFSCFLVDVFQIAWNIAGQHDVSSSYIPLFLLLKLACLISFVEFS